MVLNAKIDMNLAALLHCISLHKQAKQRFHMNIAVSGEFCILVLFAHILCNFYNVRTVCGAVASSLHPAMDQLGLKL